MNNITVEYLFLLINERMDGGLSTLVTTQSHTAAARERYGERVFLAPVRPLEDAGDQAGRKGPQAVWKPLKGTC